jgi:hypothetical protein
MVRLNLSSEPRWITLIEGSAAGEPVEVLVEPITTAVMYAVRQEVREKRGVDPEEDLRDGESAASMALQVDFHKALAARIIRDWRGVLDDNGKPARVTPETCAALMDILLAYEAWVLKVFGPFAGMELEKNGSAPLPNGTSAGATNTAQRARANAKNARRGSTRRKR